MENEKTEFNCGCSSSCRIFSKDKIWSYYVQPINHTKQHSVLFELPPSGSQSPKPHFSKNLRWDSDHVRLPHLSQNLYPSKEDSNKLKSRWEMIQCALLQPILSSRALESVIRSYSYNLPKFSALHHLFEEELDESESEKFFENLLPKIIELALSLPELIPTNIPLLKQGNWRSLSLSQLQIACLLANAFLCTFPWGKEIAATYPGINFAKLFSAHSRPRRINSVSEKLKCVINYFRRVIHKIPVGVITFERKCVQKHQMPRWDNLENQIIDIHVNLASNGTIENDGIGCLQVDFANKYVGGGVLGYGCVQEEIRFVVCPELIVSRLFVEQLAPNEALEIIGVERFNSYSGYGEDFIWEGDYVDQTPFDDYKRRRTTIVAIDALHFSRSTDQFYPSAILRELNKAYVGFHSRESLNLSPIATGNWGCGAFQGDKRLKFLIQLMACTVTKRDMIYFTFDDVELQEELHKMHRFLVTENISICKLWRYLCKFANAKLSGDQLPSFLCQVHFDCLKENTVNDSQQDIKMISEPSTSFSTNGTEEVFDKKPQFQFSESTNRFSDSSSTDSVNKLITNESSLDEDVFEPELQLNIEPMDVTSVDKPKNVQSDKAVKAEDQNRSVSLNSEIPTKMRITDYFERKLCK